MGAKSICIFKTWGGPWIVYRLGTGALLGRVDGGIVWSVDGQRCYGRLDVG